MTGNKGKNGGGEQGKPRFTRQYDFSDLKGAHPSKVAFEYIDHGWRIVPVDRRTGEVLVITGDIDEETGYFPLIPAWTDDPDIEIGISTGLVSGVVALRCKKRVLQHNMLRALLARHEPLDTLQNDGENGLCVLFRAPKEGLPSRLLGQGVEFLGEGDHFVPSQSSWNPRNTELAPMPDWLLSEVRETQTLSLTERVAAGDFAALNKVTAFAAAQEYTALGWKLLPVGDEGEYNVGPEEFSPAELWRDEPKNGIGFWAGTVSGVVGLVFADYRPLNALEAEYGPLPYPRISGTHPAICFRAPKERFPFKKLTEGIWYIGEDNVLPVPPSIVSNTKLEWTVEKKVSPELPELPQWLHDILSGKQEMVVAAQPSSKAAKKAPKKGGSGRAKPLGAVAEAQPRTQSPLEVAALRLAEEGYLVFPIKENEEKPQFAKGFNKATTERITISQWWKKFPNANVGIQTGTNSGLVVLAVDIQSVVPTLDDLVSKLSQIVTLRAQTPSGRLQLFFRAPAREVGSSRGFQPGLDFFGNGAYVVVAPSRVGEREYHWVDPNVKVAETPDWLLTLVVEQAQKTEGAPTSGSTAAKDSGVMWQQRLDKWLAARCEVEEGLSAKASDLLADFSTWLGEDVTVQRFGRLLGEKGFVSYKSSVYWYAGLRLQK